jgi:hypothetical protein
MERNEYGTSKLPERKNGRIIFKINNEILLCSHLQKSKTLTLPNAGKVIG